MKVKDPSRRGVDKSDASGVGRDMGPLVRVYHYSTPQEAAIAQGFLENNGIPAFVQAGEVATALAYFGTAVGGARLDVPKSLAEKAVEVLTEKFGNDDVVAMWKCPNCGAEVDAGFEICWQCSTPHPGDVIDDVRANASVARKPAANASDASFDLDDDSGEVESARTSDAEDDYPGDEILDRALRAAAFGIVFIPLSFYAMFLLVDACNARRSDTGRWKLILAHILAYLPIGTYLAAVLFGVILSF